MEYELYRDDELAHHGIVGMKWGVRRYQNRDGTLTSAGKRRLEKETEKAKAEAKILKNRKATKDKIDKLAARQKANAELKRELDEAEGKGSKSKHGSQSRKDNGDKPAAKTVNNMTNEELMVITERMRLQKNYIDAQKQLAEATPQQVSKGQRLVRGLAEKAVPKLTDAVMEVGANYVKKTLSKKLGIDGDSLDKFAVAKRDAEYWKNLNTAKQQKDQYERNVANDGKPKGMSNDSDKLNAKAAAKAQAKADKAAAKAQAKADKAAAKAQAKADKAKQGTVEGVGNSNNDYGNARKRTDPIIIDADYYEVVNDNNVSSGKSYVSSYLALPASTPLALPAPKDDY